MDIRHIPGREMQSAEIRLENMFNYNITEKKVMPENSLSSKLEDALCQELMITRTRLK
jgi:hypothetical protein